MNRFTDSEIAELNKLLHICLGIEGEEILFRWVGNDWNALVGPEQTSDDLKGLDDVNFKTLYQVLHFYYPRWIAYNAIQKSDDRYSEYSSNNEVLLALTSIIDWLANPTDDKRGYTTRFIKFLETNLSKIEIELMTKDSSIARADGSKDKIASIEEFGKYVYEVRSHVIHKAELGGMYPWRVDFDIDYEAGKAINHEQMVTPKNFRRYLWKAIFHSIGLDIIKGDNNLKQIASPRQVVTRNDKSP